MALRVVHAMVKCGCGTCLALACSNGALTSPPTHPVSDVAAAADTPTLAPDTTRTETETPAPPDVGCTARADCPQPTSPCQVAACDPQFGCLLKALPDGTVCNDGDACTKSSSCAAGMCVGAAPLPCQDGDACTTDACDKGKGCIHAPAPDGHACDDGQACTAGDTCAKGVCVPGKLVCQCQQDADCLPFDDGNACTGLLYCDNANGKCAVNQATVVQCGTAGSGPCAQNACDPKTGKCALQPKNAGLACDDDDPCTAPGTCVGTACKPGANLCKCAGDDDCKPQEDGDQCNGTLYCDKASGKCLVNPATVVTCPTAGDTACQKTACVKASGTCVAAQINEGKACDDGDPCTSGDACQSGACKPAANTCKCKADADCLGEEDGNQCNGTLYCDKPTGKCTLNPATVVTCKTVDDTLCSKRICQPKTGECALIAVNEGGLCDDGAACTTGDTCEKGSCIPGSYTCVCAKDGDCSKFDDGDLCNGSLYCDKTGKLPECKVNPATVVQCDPGVQGACTKAVCQAATGKCATVKTNCDDGDLCTLDLCQEPTGCTAFPVGPVVCQDGNACTDDTCAPKLGCQHSPNAKPCADGNLCTEKDTCKLGVCVGGAAVGCDDKNACTSDTCDPEKGCAHAALDGPKCDDAIACTGLDQCVMGKCLGQSTCSDGDPCTGDVCDAKSGQCQFPPAGLNCDDLNGCTADACKPKVGCVHLPVAATCDDLEPCTTGDQCQDGQCQGSAAKDCDDAQPCTDDTCKNGLGCTHAFNTAPCDDGIACTTSDACKKGQCQGAIGCDDGKPCTKDACDVASGTCYATALDSGKCDDGNACTAEETCKSGNCVPGALVTCDDGNVCTTEFCDKAKGCQFAANTLPCNANKCTAGDACQAKLCVSSGKTRYGLMQLAAVDGAWMLASMLAVPQGFVLAGTWGSTSPSLPGKGGYLQRTDLFGQPQWSAKSPLGATGYPRLTALVGFQGGFVTGGHGDGNAVFSRHDEGGKLLWTVPHKALDKDAMWPLLAAREVPGTPPQLVACAYLGVGKDRPSKFDTSTVWLLDGDGSKTATLVGLKPGICSLKVQPDGSVWVLLTGDKALTVYRWDAQLQPASTWTYVAQVSYAGDFIPLSDGGALLSYNQNSGDYDYGHDTRFVRLGPDGTAVSETKAGVKGDDLAFGPMLRPDGRVVWSGRFHTGSTIGARLVETDGNGKVLWQATLEANSPDWVPPVLRLLPDGDLALASQVTYSTQPVPGLYRLSPWGHKSCTEAGLCAMPPKPLCADGNPCTWDLCDPKTGCQGVPHTLDCDDGEPCTTGEYCKGGNCVGNPTVCDDGEICTADGCENGKGCVFEPFPDGVACGGGLKCKGGVCKP